MHEACTYGCMYAYMYEGISELMCKYIRICTYTHTVYAYIHVYIHTYIHIRTYVLANNSQKCQKYALEQL